jgi:hypothetical protein
MTEGAKHYQIIFRPRKRSLFLRLRAVGGECDKDLAESLSEGEPVDEAGDGTLVLVRDWRWGEKFS